MTITGATKGSGLAWIVLCCIGLSIFAHCQTVRRGLSPILPDVRARSARAERVLKRIDRDLAYMSESVIRVRTLAVAAAHGTYNFMDRQEMTREANRHLLGIARLVERGRIDGVVLYDTSHDEWRSHIGPVCVDGGAFEITMPTLEAAQFASASWQEPGNSALNFARAGQASEWIERMDRALEALSAERARLRVELRRLQATTDRNCAS